MASERKWNFFKYAFAAGSIIVFLFYKFSHLVIHFGDGNAYIYMADAILKGNVPYRDFFLADPPFMVYLLALLKLFFGGKLILFQALPVIFEAITSGIIFLILKKWNNSFAFLAPLFYLFSFSTISTSDYLTGVQLVVMFSVLAIYFWENKWPVLSGVFWTLALLTKLYVLPAIFGFVVYIFWSERKQELKKFFYGAIVTFVVVVGPFLILAFSKVWSYLIVHQFSRPAGLDKWYVWNFFLIKGWPILLLSFVGVFISKRKSIIYPFIPIFIFFLIYQDLYYLYLQNLTPYLIVLTFSLLAWFWQGNMDRRALVGITIIFLIFFSWFYFLDYRNVFAKQGRFLNSQEIADYLRNLPEKLDLYGSHEVAPLIALESGIRLFSNYIDTNGQAFASGGLNLQAVSQESVERGIYLISKITDLPGYGIKDAGYESFFSKRVFEKFCKRIKDFPSTSGEQDNLIAIYRCKN